MAWNSSCSARFCSERRWNTLSQGSLTFSPSRMTRRYLPNTVMIATFDCGTLRNHENRKNSPMMTTTMAIGAERSMMPSMSAAGDSPADVHRAEARVPPVDDEDAEPLLDARLDVVLGGGISARHLEFLARGEHLLNRCLPSRGVEVAFALGVGGREHAAQRTGAGKQHADALDRRDLADVRQPFLGLDDRPVGQLAVGVERPQVRFVAILLFRHPPILRRDTNLVWPRAAFRREAHRGESLLHLFRALDVHEHDRAHAEIELPADVVDGLRGVGGDLRR